MDSVKRKEIVIGVAIALVISFVFLIWQDHRYDRAKLLMPGSNQSAHPGKTVSAAEEPADFSGLDEKENIFPRPEYTRYEMQLTFDPGERKLYGTSYLYTRNTSGKDLLSLPLSCYPNAFREASFSPVPKDGYPAGFNPGGLDITGAWLDEQPAAVDGNGELVSWVQLPQPIVPAAEFCLTLEWEVLIPRADYRFGAMDSVFALGNVYPTLIPYNGYDWHTPYNSKFGDLFCMQAADYSVSVLVPPGYITAASGSLAGGYTENDGRKLYQYSAAKVRDFSLIIMNNYLKSSLQSKAVAVHAYHPYGTDRPDVELIASILGYYSERFSPYPLQDFSVVYLPMKGFDGMEYSGLVLLREDYLKQKLANANFVMAHEIAHQWWYGTVGNDPSREPWLDESLANWSAYQYLREAKMAGAVRPYAAAVKLNRSLLQFGSRQEYYDIVYTKGAGFWAALEQRIGAQKLWQALQLYALAYEGKVATTAELIECIRQVTEQPLDSFFSNWIKN